jgi:hypothetical protein
MYRQHLSSVYAMIHRVCDLLLRCRLCVHNLLVSRQRIHFILPLSFETLRSYTMMTSSIGARGFVPIVAVMAMLLVAIFSASSDAVNMLRSQDESSNQRRRLSTDGGMYCGCMECNYDAWHTPAIDRNGAYTCGARIEHLVLEQGKTEYEACLQVGTTEFPSDCGRCSPVQCTPRPEPRCGCPGCDDIWDVAAGDHTCGARITWLQTSKMLQQTLTEEEACIKVGGDE